MTDHELLHGATTDVAPLAFCMQLRAGCAAEYQRRHDEIWPQLLDLLRDAGVYDYSIFLNEQTLTLFAVLRLRAQNSHRTLATHPVMQRWWAHMADLMDVQPDNRPIEWPLKPVFRMP